MIFGYDNNFTKKFVLKDDKNNPESEQTVFHYKLPSLALQHTLFDEINVEKTSNVSMKIMDDTILECLVKIENYKVKKDNQIIDVIYNEKTSIEEKKKILETIPIKYRAEIGAEIFNSMNPTPEQEKN